MNNSSYESEEKVLSCLYENTDCRISLVSLAYTTKLDRIEISRVKEKFLEHDLIRKELSSKGQECYLLNHKGISVYESGGFSKYYSSFLLQEQEKDRKSTLEMKKLENEVVLTQWQYRTFWAGAVLGIIGGAKAIIELFVYITSSK